MRKITIRHVSHAILLVNGNYVMQLRDNKSTIPEAGRWSLFGGKMKANEQPLDAIKREIREELSLAIKEFRFLWRREYYLNKKKIKVRAWFFVSDISSKWGKHRLLEGQGAGVFSFKEVKRLDVPLVIKNVITHYHARDKYS